MLNASLTDQLYDIIKDQILTGKLQAGERIDVQKLSKQFQISQTPVRFALNRLHDAGLVENRTRIGFFVVEFDAKDLADTYELRELLEIHALKSAIQNRDPSFWLDLRGRVEAIGSIESEDEKRAQFDITDTELHTTIIEAADNKKSQEVFMHLHDSIKLSLVMGGKLDKSLGDHLAILDALINEDLPAAETVLRRHIRDSKEAMIRQFLLRNQKQSDNGEAKTKGGVQPSPG